MRLCVALKLLRATKNVGIREQAKDIGISAATLSRIERGETCDTRSLVKLFTWLIEPDKAA